MKQRRGIRRVFVRAGIFLLLGAIVNIAVAWGCAFAKTRILGPDADWWGFDYGLSWPTSTPEGWPAPNRLEWICNPGTRDHWAMYLALDESPSVGYSECSLYYHEAGWPTLSVQSVEWWQFSASGRSQSTRWIAGVAVRGVSGHDVHLPVLPLWPGFAINTLFYAAILWLLLAVPGALRRWRRIKRGLCPACAYPVATSNLCTECGKPIPSPLRGRAREGVEGTSSNTAPNDTAHSTLPRPLPVREGSQRPASP